MKKSKNISEYFENSHLTVEDMKDMILRSSLDLGCYAVNNFGGDVFETSHVFTTLYYFNDILDNVE